MRWAVFLFILVQVGFLCSVLFHSILVKCIYFLAGKVGPFKLVWLVILVSWNGLSLFSSILTGFFVEFLLKRKMIILRGLGMSIHRCFFFFLYNDWYAPFELGSVAFLEQLSLIWIRYDGWAWIICLRIGRRIACNGLAGLNFMCLVGSFFSSH